MKFYNTTSKNDDKNFSEKKIQSDTVSIASQNSRKVCAVSVRVIHKWRIVDGVKPMDRTRSGSIAKLIVLRVN